MTIQRGFFVAPRLKSLLKGLVYLKHEQLSPYLLSKEHFGQCNVVQEDRLWMFVTCVYSLHTYLVRKCH